MTVLIVCLKLVSSLGAQGRARPLPPEVVVPLRLVALDPNTPGDDCPAMFIDTETGEMVFQGVTETNPETLAEINAVSRLKPDESAVRLPERMRNVILKALTEADGGRADPESDSP